MVREGSKKKSKPMSRQARYERGKQIEAAQQTKQKAARSAIAPRVQSTKGKERARENADEPHPFKYKSFNDRLASVRINVATDLGRSGTGALAGLDAYDLAARSEAATTSSFSASATEAMDLDDASLHATTPFALALNAWKELNLSLPFASLAHQLGPITSSLPLLLHNQEKVATLLADTLAASSDDSYLSYEPALDLIPRLATDIGSAFLLSFEKLLGAILRTSTINKLNCGGEEYTAAVIVERSFESLAATLRCMAPHILQEQDISHAGSKDWLVLTWHTIRPYLGWAPPTSQAAMDGEMFAKSTSRRKNIPPYTRRFASEALAHLVRRAKDVQMLNLATLMQKDAQEAYESHEEATTLMTGVAGVWSEVVQSVEGKLHSKAPSFLTIILQDAVENIRDGKQELPASLGIGIYLIASTVNYAKPADLECIATWLLDILDKHIADLPTATSSDRSFDDKFSLSRIIQWLSVFVGLRKGRQVSDAVKVRLFASLNALSTSTYRSPSINLFDDALLGYVVDLFVFSLPVARLQDMMGPVLSIVRGQADAVLQGTSSPPQLMFAPLCLKLAEAHFHGFEQTILPVVFHLSQRIFLKEECGSRNSSQILLLLSELQRLQVLKTNSAQPLWHQSLATVVLKHIESLTKMLASRYPYPPSSYIACLNLASSLSDADHALDVTDRLCQLIAEIDSKTASIDEMKRARDAFNETHLNIPAILGLAFASLKTLLASIADATLRKECLSRFSRIAKSGVLQRLAVQFAWHKSFLVNLGTLISSYRETSIDPALELSNSLLEACNDALCASDTQIRRAAAQILLGAKQSERHASVLALVLQIEECGLEVDRIRERNVLMRKLGRSIASDSEIDNNGDLDRGCYDRALIRYVVSSMKLNLRPLWSESRATLGDISLRLGQEVWQIAFEELKTAFCAVCSWERYPLEWRKGAKLPDENQGSGCLDESGLYGETPSVAEMVKDPQWLCRIREMRASHRWSLEVRLRSSIESSQISGVRLDRLNYQNQILLLFAELNMLTERNNAAFLDHFFSSVVSRNDATATSQEEDDDDESDSEGSEVGGEVVTANLIEDGAMIEPMPLLSRKERQSQLCKYLQIFGQFSNPKAIHRSRALRSYLYQLCSQGEVQIQRLALEAILRWKDAAHVAHASLLRAILEPATFREQLSAFSLAPDADASLLQSQRSSLLPLLLRLFFGLIISKAGRRGGHANRRSSILSALALITDDEMHLWSDIMLESFKDICDDQTDSRSSSRRTGPVFEPSLKEPQASTKSQQGFLNLLEDVLKYLGPHLRGVWKPLLTATLNITITASRYISNSEQGASKVHRSMRQDGLRLINLFFIRVETSADEWRYYLPAIFAYLISPRLASLPVESSQHPSPILELAHTWSGDADIILFLVQYDKALLPSALACVYADNVSTAVTTKVLEIMECITSFSVELSGTAEAVDVSKNVVNEQVFQPHLSTMLRAIGSLLQQVNRLSYTDYRKAGGEGTAHRLLDLLLGVAPRVHETSETETLLHLLSNLLRRSHIKFHEKGTIAILSVLDRLLPSWIGRKPDKATLDVLCEPLSILFSRLKSRQGRVLLCNIFDSLAKADDCIRVVSPCLADLNAYDQRKMEEYDFDRRLTAFETIEQSEGELKSATLSSKQWLPLLHNFIYFLQDSEELALRASAASALRHYIDNVSQAMTVEDARSGELQSLLLKTVFPGLRRALRSSSDLVKREAVEVLGHAVSRLSSLPFAKGLQGLLVEGDDEANFFTNIFHIQTHRRARAINRLATESRRGVLDGRVIDDIFLPIVESFLLIDVNHGDSNIVQSAVECIGSLAGQLRWGPYNVLLWRFLSFSKEKDEDVKITEKVSIRAAMSILDNFHFDLDSSLADGDLETASEDDANVKAELALKGEHSRKLLDAVRNRLLPKLMSCLEVKDELEDVVRIPIAIGIARILLRFPDKYRKEDVRRLLNGLGHILRSKSQDTRDLVRSTLSKVAIVLGPDFFPMLVRELRKVLSRGPQVAVLAFTVHNVLLHCIEIEAADKPKMLDDGTDVIVDIVIEDVFGRTAEDRQSIENRTTYREVKSSRSLDTIEHVARVVHGSRIRDLLVPLKSLMSQTESAQVVRLIEEYLRRVTIGLQANGQIDNREYLILCNALLDRKSSLMSIGQGRARNVEERRTSALLGKRQDFDSGPQRDHFAHNMHRFTTFGLDLLTASLRKERLDFTEADTLAMLEPMTDLVGSTLFASQAALVIGGMRCMSLLLRCPLRSVKTSTATVLRQALKIVERQGNARSETMIAAIKLLTALLKEFKADSEQDVQRLVSEKQVSLLCRIIESNLDEDVEMQSTLFALLRSLISRKVAVTELYDLMDRVARLSVVHQNDAIRSMARSSFIAFLTDMPQGRKRFDNQMHFLIKNLEYMFESGRKSVLDTLSLMLAKVSNDALKPHLELIFVGLVMRLANEESTACREDAVSIIKQIFKLCDDSDLESLVSLTRRWCRSSYEDTNGRKLLCVTMMLNNILIEELAKDHISLEADWVNNSLVRATSILEFCTDVLEQQEARDDAVADPEPAQYTADGLAEWQLPYQALQFVTRAYRNRAVILPTVDREAEADRFLGFWALASRLLLYPHAWIRLSACRLLGEQFNGLAADEGPDADTLASRVEMCKRFALILQSPNVDDVLATQVTKNLVFVARGFYQIDKAFDAQTSSERPTATAVEGEEDRSLVDQDGQFWIHEPLRWLFNKLSHQLRRASTERLYISQGAAVSSQAILKWMAAIVTLLDAEAASKYLVHIVTPIFRLLEGGAATNGGTEGSNNVALRADSAGAVRRSALESLAREVQDLVQSKLGTKRFAKCYADVKRKATGKRRERRERTTQSSILHPERAVERKVQRNVRKHQGRKRKAEAFSMSKERVRSTKRQR